MVTRLQVFPRADIQAKGLLTLSSDETSSTVSINRCLQVILISSRVPLIFGGSALMSYLQFYCPIIILLWSEKCVALAMVGSMRQYLGIAIISSNLDYILDVNKCDKSNRKVSIRHTWQLFFWN